MFLFLLFWGVFFQHTYSRFQITLLSTVFRALFFKRENIVFSDSSWYSFPCLIYNVLLWAHFQLISIVLQECSLSWDVEVFWQNFSLRVHPDFSLASKDFSFFSSNFPIVIYSVMVYYFVQHFQLFSAGGGPFCVSWGSQIAQSPFHGLSRTFLCR